MPTAREMIDRYLGEGTQTYHAGSTVRLKEGARCKVLNGGSKNCGGQIATIIGPGEELHTYMVRTEAGEKASVHQDLILL